MTEYITPSPSSNETATGTSSDPAPLEEIPVLDGTEINNDSQPLYPSVQHALDDLKRMINERSEAVDIQRTASGEPIVTPEIIEAWASEAGFSNGKRGTFHNDNTYLYIKRCNLVPKEEDIDETIATARHLTSLGAIHPES